MDQDVSRPAAVTASPNSTPTPPRFRQAVAGVTPPQHGEALIRENWPAVLGLVPALAGLARTCIRSIILAPVGWLALAPLFALKFGPFLCKRYTLTNRRLMIQKGWKPAPAEEVPLGDIEEVRLAADSYDAFYHSGDLEVVVGGQVKMTLKAVPEPEGFRHAVLNAIQAWAPGKIKSPFQPASEIKA